MKDETKRKRKRRKRKKGNPLEKIFVLPISKISSLPIFLSTFATNSNEVRSFKEVDESMEVLTVRIYIYIYIHLLIHNRKKNRGSDILFPRRIFLTDSNKFGIQPNFYTMLRRSRFPTRRNKPHRDAKWNFTRGANGISDKLDDSNVAWEDFSLYHYSPTNLERARTFLSLRRDRSRIAAGRIKGE